MWKHLRKLHWSLSLIIVLQFFIWSFSGAYMVLMDISFIRGNHLISPPVNLHSITQATHIGFQRIQVKYPTAREMTLVLTTPTPEVHFVIDDELHRVNPDTGKPANNITQDYIKHQANQWYTNTSAIIDIVRLNKAPTEISQRHKSVWKVSFDNPEAETLYFSAVSGRLVGKRHNYWRAFDWFWRFHIMDYWHGENIHNLLLSFMGLLALLTATFGLLLLVPWVKHLQRKRRSR